MQTRMLYDPNNQLPESRWERNKSALVNEGFRTMITRSINTWKTGHEVIFPLDANQLRILNRKMRVRGILPTNYTDYIINMVVDDSMNEWMHRYVELSCPTCKKSGLQPMGERLYCRYCQSRMSWRQQRKVLKQ